MIETEAHNELKRKISPMIQLLDDTDVTVLHEVQKGLFCLGNSVVPLLRNVMHTSGDSNQRRGIIDVIRLFQADNLKKLQRCLSLSNESYSAAELEQCLVYLSGFGYPETDAENISNFLDNAALEIHQRYVKNAGTNYLTLTMALNGVFFHGLGFSPNESGYFHPDSTYMFSLIAQKNGIPISLCTIYMLIAERCGIEVYGVGLPLHFIAYNCDAAMYVDVYNYGIMLSSADCASFVKKAGIEFAEDMLKKASVKSIIERKVRNLIIAHEKYGDMWEAQQLRDMLMSKK